VEVGRPTHGDDVVVLGLLMQMYVRDVVVVFAGNVCAMVDDIEGDTANVTASRVTTTTTICSNVAVGAL
jgi:hypothetical protein